jgi:hypothetical protein
MEDKKVLLKQISFKPTHVKKNEYYSIISYCVFPGLNKRLAMPVIFIANAVIISLTSKTTAIVKLLVSIFKNAHLMLIPKRRRKKRKQHVKRRRLTRRRSKILSAVQPSRSRKLTTNYSN